MPEHPSIIEPASIERFSVIRIGLRLGSNPEDNMKLLVVLGHRNDHLICIKTTSKTDLYRNNPEMRNGCVWYDAYEVDVFRKDTIIQPDNPFPLPYGNLRMSAMRHELQICGRLPDDFEQKLTAAIGASKTLAPARKANLLNLL